MAHTVDADRVAEYLDEDEDLEDKVQLLLDMFRQSNYTVFFTGAGVSTSAGIRDYRGPSGAWTEDRIKQLESLGKGTSADEEVELGKLRAEREREVRKSDTGTKLPKTMLEPGFSHIAIATLIRRGLAHYVVTTNLDGLFRKAGLRGHEELCCLHGDCFTERCTSCGTEFERNYRVRRPGRHVHDHHVGSCPSCGSAVPESWTGAPKGSVAKTHVVTMKERPNPEAVSFERVQANARKRWQGASLVAVNDVPVEGLGDQFLASVVADASLPLRFQVRVLEPGPPVKTGGSTCFDDHHLVGIEDRDVGTRDTHINFGEALDDMDWNEADAHCSKAGLCVVLGTSMSLRHVTHFPFMAKRTVIVNLQATPDDHRCTRGLRIWGMCDDVLRRLLRALAVEPLVPPPWIPRDAVPLEKLKAMGAAWRADLAVARHIHRAAGKRAPLDVLTADQIEAFKRDGYIVVSGIFSLGDVAEYLSKLDAWLASYGVQAKGKENWERVMDTFGGFLEMHYGEAKELLWGHDRFDRAWTDIFRVYAFADTPGFEHCMGEFDPQEKYLFPDRACMRFPDRNALEFHRRGKWERQVGTGEHVDWDVYSNVYGQGVPELGVWEQSSGGVERHDDLPVWRPVQCSVAFSDAAAGEGNFQVAPGWHLRMADFSGAMRERFSGGDFRKGFDVNTGVFKLRKADGYEDEMLSDFVDVPVRAGDVIFWDTRLPHSNHSEHRGASPRICDFNARVPGTEMNRAWARRMWTELFSQQLHGPSYPSRLAALEGGPLPTARLNSLARRVLCVPGPGEDGEGTDDVFV